MRVEKEDWTGLAGEFTLSMFLASCFTVLFWSFYLLLVLPCFFVLDALELLVLLISLFRLARISLVFFIQLSHKPAHVWSRFGISGVLFHGFGRS